MRVIERTAELTEAQELLQKSLHNERQMLLEQRQFLSMVGHEFRTPLAIIDAAATNLQALKTLDIENQQHRLDKIRRATRSLSTLIDNCMTSERIELGGFTVMRQDTAVAQLVLETAQIVSFSPRHTLVIECANPDETWNLDPALIKIALSNLIDNAVKYSSGGTVTVTVSESVGELIIAVSNYGYGVATDEVEWLFSKYVRGSAALQGKGIRGSGLGLYICKRIAQAHGGDVRLMPEREGATVFELRIGG